MNRHIAFFDLDGTLTDPRVGISACVSRALQSMGKPVPPQNEIDAWIGPPLFDSFLGYLESEQAAREALERYRDRFAKTGMYENEVYAGIDDILRQLSVRCRAMYVVTSKPRVFASRIVAHFGLAPFFAGVYGSELDGALTDKTELIAHVLREESLAAQTVTMVGDRRHDVVGARNNGVRSVGVLWGYGSRGELERAGADYICSSVAELPAAVVEG